jgi:hypothetical protein
VIIGTGKLIIREMQVQFRYKNKDYKNLQTNLKATGNRKRNWSKFNRMSNKKTNMF